MGMKRTAVNGLWINLEVLQTSNRSGTEVDLVCINLWLRSLRWNEPRLEPYSRKFDSGLFFFKYIRQFFMVGDPLLFYLGIAQIKAGLNLAITGNLQEIKKHKKKPSNSIHNETNVIFSFIWISFQSLDRNGALKFSLGYSGNAGLSKKTGLFLVGRPGKIDLENWSGWFERFSFSKVPKELVWISRFPKKSTRCRNSTSERCLASWTTLCTWKENRIKKQPSIEKCVFVNVHSIDSAKGDPTTTELEFGIWYLEEIRHVAQERKNP